MAGSDSLSEADVKRLLRMSNSQSGGALKERVRQMDHSPQLHIIKHKYNCKDPRTCHFNVKTACVPSVPCWFHMCFRVYKQTFCTAATSESTVCQQHTFCLFVQRIIFGTEIVSIWHPVCENCANKRKNVIKQFLRIKWLSLIPIRVLGFPVGLLSECHNVLVLPGTLPGTIFS